MHKTISVSVAALTISVLMLSESALAAEIVASAQPSFLTPPVAPRDESVANGDFFITGTTRGRGTGTGTDESTLWAFNFRTDRDQWRAFRVANPGALSSAIVILRLETNNPQGQSNDQLTLGDLPPIGVEALLPGGIHRVRINLLNEFSDTEILDILRRQGPDGVIFAHYLDDAIVHGATLILRY